MSARLMRAIGALLALVAVVLGVSSPAYAQGGAIGSIAKAAYAKAVTNTSSSAANAGAISTLNGLVAANGSAIGGLQGRVTATEGSISTLSGSVSTNSSAIGTLQTRATAIESNASTMSGLVSANGTNITALQSRATTDEAAITANSNAIVANKAVAPPVRYDNTIAAIGDSITANSNLFDKTQTGSNTWAEKGPFTFIIARSGGRLRAVDIPGWPFTNTAPNSTGFGACLVAAGGQNYTSQTTLGLQTGVGVTGAAIAPIITNGAITGCNITSAGTGYLGQSPLVTVTDPGGGTGAVVMIQVAKAGEFASGGISCAEAMAYVPLFLNNGNPLARNAYMAIGTNDDVRGMTLAQSKTCAITMAQQLMAGGVRVFYQPPLERGGASGTSAQMHASALRRWAIANFAAIVPGVVVIDPSLSAWVDPSQPSSVIPDAYAGTDKLHPLIAGGDVLGKAAWAQMAPYFASVGPTTSGLFGDAYNATLNPTGNLLSTAQALTSSRDTATPDATNEAPFTGTRMQGVFLSRVSGGTASCTCKVSVVARADGLPGSQLLIQASGTGAAAGEIYRLTWSTNGTSPTLAVGGSNALQVGDRIVFVIDSVTFSAISNIKATPLRLTGGYYAGGTIAPTAASVQPNPTGTSAWGDFSDGTFPAWTGDIFSLPTREMVIPPSTSWLTASMDFVVNAAGSFSFTVQLGGAAIRKVASSPATSLLDLPRVPANDDVARLAA